MKKTHIWVLSILLTVLLGCGPQYRTNYFYELPNSERGRHCIIQCQAMKQKCLKYAERSYRSCLDRNALVAISKQRVSQIASNSLPHKDETVLQRWQRERDEADFKSTMREENCTEIKLSQEATCLPDYHSCYELCGGVVIAEQECVMFCGNQ